MLNAFREPQRTLLWLTVAVAGAARVDQTGARPAVPADELARRRRARRLVVRGGGLSSGGRCGARGTRHAQRQLARPPLPPPRRGFFGIGVTVERRPRLLAPGVVAFVRVLFLI